MEQQKIYEIPEMEFIPVDNGDIIVTSGINGGFDTPDPWDGEDAPTAKWNEVGND